MSIKPETSAPRLTGAHCLSICAASSQPLRLHAFSHTDWEPSDQQGAKLRRLMTLLFQNIARRQCPDQGRENTGMEFKGLHLRPGCPPPRWVMPRGGLLCADLSFTICEVGVVAVPSQALRVIYCCMYPKKSFLSYKAQQFSGSIILVKRRSQGAEWFSLLQRLHSGWICEAISGFTAQGSGDFPRVQGLP